MATPTKGKRDPHLRALEAIRSFLESKSCYDILPESFRLIVFDNKLGITRSLQALVTNGVVSAPLYDSTTQRFAGMFTLADVVHLIQYYYLTAHEYENVVAEVEAFQLESLRKIEQAIDVPPPPTISVHPDQPLSDACAALVRTHARRLPLVDRDDQTGKETIVSVLTQYRVLKFIAINCQHDCARLDQSIGSLGIGSYASWYQPSTGLEATSSSSAAGPQSGEMSNKEGAEGSTNKEQEKSPSTTEPIDGVHLDEELMNGAAPAPKVKDDVAGQEPTPTPTPPPAVTRHDSSATVTASSHSASASASKSSPPLAPLTTAPPSTTTEEEPPTSSFSVSPSSRYFPLSTATMDTSVFDVVHIFSERGISAVPILDEEGVVLNMYETVDIVDLVRTNAYQILDGPISLALSQRSTDFTGVITCTPLDTLSSILAYIRERRCHRFVIVEPEDVPADPTTGAQARKKGSLVGILSLSDVLRYLVGHENLKGHEVPGLGEFSRSRCCDRSCCCSASFANLSSSLFLPLPPLLLSNKQKQASTASADTTTRRPHLSLSKLSTSYTPRTRRRALRPVLDEGRGRRIREVLSVVWRVGV
ncbi:hypothetical protein BCR35DRAFT_300936 [Leucosporidium creatinivorum]|uniref:CBS domain-containing protein n=1 Tax=Leucosporidium creatinivorum TaxID=106004 RepID=A0A1Y2FYK8_9BASI|nr:hypothetical protein BCR35DRAFT_300936 [Leucosporidium creatinivorum]